LNKFYVGATQEDVKVRIEHHNSAAYGKDKFTASANDWTLFLFIPANDYPHVIRIERKIKAMKSKVYIQNLQKYPDLLLKLVSST
jgi:putative endonuclease